MADFGDLARDLLQQKFPLFGSFRSKVVYQNYPEGVYDPDTGIYDVGMPTEYDLWIILLGFSFTKNQSNIKQLDDQVVLARDMKAIFPAADLPVDPKIGDMFVTSNGTYYRIIGVNQDPKPAHWNLHVRPYEES